MRRIVLLFLLSVQTVFAAAECGVDASFKAAFLPGQSVRCEWSEDYPLGPQLEDFEFLAALESVNGRSISIAWKGEQPASAARELFRRRLLEEGWLALPDEGVLALHGSRGFLPHDEPATSQIKRFCRPGEGSLNIRAVADAGNTVFTAHFWNHAETGSCDAEFQRGGGMVAHHQRLMQQVPALRLPEGVDVVPGGTNWSGNGGEARALVKLDMRAAQLASHFEDQMIAQGWRMDARFEGAASAGHFWLKTGEKRNLSCLLSVIESGPRLLLRLQVEPLESPSADAGVGRYAPFPGAPAPRRNSATAAST